MVSVSDVEAFVSQTLERPWITDGAPIDSSGRRQAALFPSATGPTVFVKYSEGPEGLRKMQCEEEALQRMGNVPGVEIPQTLGVIGTTEQAALVMEAVDVLVPTAEHWGALGKMVAKLHLHTSSRPGLDHDNFIGDFPQANTSHRNSWNDFFIHNRALPMLERAARLSLLRQSEIKRINYVLERIDDIAPPNNQDMSLLHGDLWTGNTLAAANGPVLIDPAQSFGNREMDIAFSKMAPHVTFPDAFYTNYNEVFPLAAGHEYREGLWQLWPFLTHIVQDGRRWVPPMLSVLSHY